MVFQDRRQYRVPFNQRAYVWNRDDQWDRLWGDIRDRAEARLQGDNMVRIFNPIAHTHFGGEVGRGRDRRAGAIGGGMYALERSFLRKTSIDICWQMRRAERS